MTHTRPDEGLIVRNLSVRYGRRPVLADVQAGPFPHGAVCAVLGPNGSGKSTLLRAMGGLLRATGTLTLDGVDLTPMPLALRARHCLYLPQALPELVRLSVLDAMLAARHATGRQSSASTAEDIDAAMACLHDVGIAHLATRSLHELSGGQRQLAGLAQALGRKPRALLLDEPLSALDPYYQQTVMALLRRETAQRNLVTIIVLHDLNIALNQCDLACLLHNGRILAYGRPADVLTPEHLRTVYHIDARVDEGANGQRFISTSGVICGE
ncbi:ABC transporter ATP-binding protein [Acetobacter lambici]|uniref:ABC transporter ATP-binding protein n=1 Tax=Acetobacter lambici TaxID=1332824 RepID=A0ABT1F2W9_9PROT|nr:ABC transporter ATP-binding protein [Acetobacter lambici]MCP1243192.1 ABC transporter ATP-binding protein [Acetobacter lambici]MCP1258478.1 ABC transporter ATP-binding protein [Acetobacter lambici]